MEGRKFFWAYQIEFSRSASTADVPEYLMEVLQKQYNEGYDTSGECYNAVGQIVWVCQRRNLSFDFTRETIEVKGNGWHLNMYIKVRITQ